MTDKEVFKELIFNSIKTRKDTISIPKSFSEDKELRETYQICRILDEYLPNFFINKKQKFRKNDVIKEIDKIINNFKEEVLNSLLPEKEKFKDELKNKKESFKNIFEFAGCENLYLSNLYTRFISENMGHKFENIAQISDKTFIPEQEINLKIKGIDLIIYHDQKIKYVQ